MRVGSGHDTHRLVEGRPLDPRRRARRRIRAASPATATPTSCCMPSPTPCSARPAWATSATSSRTPIPAYKDADSRLVRDATRCAAEPERLAGRSMSM